MIHSHVDRIEQDRFELAIQNLRYLRKWYKSQLYNSPHILFRGAFKMNINLDVSLMQHDNK